ncbi:predicted protein [Streptomyces sp. AA4]|nr:predicted protein [Streptomyces sp. AA4]
MELATCLAVGVQTAPSGLAELAAGLLGGCGRRALAKAGGVTVAAACGLLFGRWSGNLGLRFGWL